MNKWVRCGIFGVLGAIIVVGVGYVGMLEYDEVEQTVSYGCGYLQSMKDMGVKFETDTSQICIEKNLMVRSYGFNPYKENK